MRWLPTLFAAEAIPSAMITFVALLMFVQLGVGWGMSTLLCGLLTLPWVLKSLVRQRVQRIGRLRPVLCTLEAAIFGLLVALAFSFGGGQAAAYSVFAVLFVMCLLCAWHELAAGSYFERMLSPREQRYYHSQRTAASQTSNIVTYGLMLMAVGALEVFYHNRSQAIALSWSTAVYLLAGFYLLLFCLNLFWLRRTPKGDGSSGAAQAESGRTVSRAFVVTVLCLFLLLLPQSLLFYTRVLFLIAPVADGGLGCSLQWIALAQGTVGVIAFSAGLGLGHRLERKSRVFSRLSTAHVTLVLSPFVYWCMTQWPPQSLAMLCVATFVAQGTFGLGLNACIPYVRALSGDRYRNTLNYLYIPLVALVMLVPLSLSGWLLSCTGFRLFFALDAFTALPALAAGLWGKSLRQ
ncbi:MAG: hypothetical protein IJ767_00525 [Bacteroidaceae bacterium]|nr:hypothetical protein [Bacteroidaceae bacterium]